MPPKLLSSFATGVPGLTTAFSEGLDFCFESWDKATLDSFLRLLGAGVSSSVSDYQNGIRVLKQRCDGDNRFAYFSFFVSSGLGRGKRFRVRSIGALFSALDNLNILPKP